jgi:hypothetical protein
VTGKSEPGNLTSRWDRLSENSVVFRLDRIIFMHNFMRYFTVNRVRASEEKCFPMKKNTLDIIFWRDADRLLVR